MKENGQSILEHGKAYMEESWYGFRSGAEVTFIFINALFKHFERDRRLYKNILRRI